MSVPALFHSLELKQIETGLNRQCLETGKFSVASKAQDEKDIIVSTPFARIVLLHVLSAHTPDSKDGLKL